MAVGELCSSSLFLMLFGRFEYVALESEASCLGLAVVCLVLSLPLLTM